MSIFVLLLTAIALCISISSITTSIVLYLKFKEKWRLVYLLFGIGMIIYLFVYQYKYIYDVFIAYQYTQSLFYFFIESIFTSIDTLLFIFLIFYLHDKKLPNLIKITIWGNFVFLLLITLTFFPSVYFLTEESDLTSLLYLLFIIANIFDYLLFTGFGLYFLFNWKKVPDKIMKQGMFMVILVTLFIIPLWIINQYLVSQWLPKNYYFLNEIITPVYTLLWFGTILYFNINQLKRLATQNQELSSDFIHKYEITKREKDIILHLLKGIESNKIAEQLFISRKTVNTHIYNIYKKCDISNRVELVNLVGQFKI
ncbi:MAG: LuxR C-terminal-related transcriptional regulator [Spirochaetes bacterium]|nr:LuxR C-terminal-related transcriptional regulator [Spirochaetota bacterium]